MSTSMEAQLSVAYDSVSKLNQALEHAPPAKMNAEKTILSYVHVYQYICLYIRQIYKYTRHTCAYVVGEKLRMWVVVDLQLTIDDLNGYY